MVQSQKIGAFGFTPPEELKANTHMFSCEDDPHTLIRILVQPDEENRTGKEGNAH